MATLSAIQPRPYVLPMPVVAIQLVLATAEDLKVFKGHNAANKPTFGLRTGLIYWLLSTVTGVIEPTPRVITTQTNPDEIKEWLKFNMIYIAKYPIGSMC